MFNPAGLFARINQLDWYKRTHRHWVDELKLSENLELMEIGCSSGELSRYINNLNIKVTGLDTSKSALELAQEHNDEIVYLRASALEIPIKDNQFDSVIAASLLNIIPNKEKLVREMYRVCKPGGKVSVLVPKAGFNDHDLLSLINTYQLTGFSLACLRAWHKKPPKMSKQQLSLLLLDAGFSNLKLNYYLKGMVISMTAYKHN